MSKTVQVKLTLEELLRLVNILAFFSHFEVPEAYDIKHLINVLNSQYPTDVDFMDPKFLDSYKER